MFLEFISLKYYCIFFSKKILKYLKVSKSTIFFAGINHLDLPDTRYNHQPPLLVRIDQIIIIKRLTSYLKDDIFL
jgi:hypothetical protein